MNEKPAFVSLVVAIVLLLGVAGVLTSILFNMSVSTPQAEEIKPLAPLPPKDKSPAAVSSINIEVPPGPGETASKPSVSGLPLPQANPPVPTSNGASGATASPAATPPVSAPSDSIGKVVVARGSAFAVDAAMRRRPLGTDSPVFMLESIETGPSSRISIEFRDGSTTFQGENTSIILDEYIYDPQKTEEPRFSMRVVRGICRAISGLISSDRKADRFNVRTRMASIGIRGCEMAFRSGKDQDDVYIMSLGPGETVQINAATDGRPLHNLATGASLPLDATERTRLEIDTSRTRVSLGPGRAPRKTEMTPEEMRAVTSDTSHLTPSRHELNQTTDGALITIPPRQSSSEGSGGPK